MRRASLFGLVISIGSLGCGAPQAAAPPPAGPVTTVAIPDEKRPERAESSDGDAKAEKEEEKTAVGNLWGDEIGEAFGTGGLGLAGVGEGGGGRGEGIGLGTTGTLGHGAGTGTGQGFGSGSGRLGGSRSGSKARVSAATASTAGSGLPPEVIQRIVRSRLGAIRLCYERAVTKDPTIGGKIAVKFTIDASGSVSGVQTADTTIADADMVSCVLGVVRGTSFPAPESGGTMNVTYPFNFAPGDP